MPMPNESTIWKLSSLGLWPLVLSLPLALSGCATPVPVDPPKPKPMPEALQKVEPRDDLCRMQQILGEACSSSEPIF